MDTPIYDDIRAAYDAGIREYHVHWRLELEFRGDPWDETPF